MAEEIDAGVSLRAPLLQLLGLEDEDDVYARPGQLEVTGEGQWPRWRTTVSSAVRSVFAGTHRREGEEGSRGGIRKGMNTGVSTTLKGGRGAARQLPGSHAAAGGELPACLA